MKKRAFINVVGIILILLSFVFIVIQIGKMEVDFELIFTPVTVAMLIVFPFLHSLVIFINAYCWDMMLSFLSGKEIPIGDAFGAYAKSNVMKYLPGNVGHYAGRQVFGAKLGLKQTHLATASILEISYSILSLVGTAVLFSAKTVINELCSRLSNELLTLLAVTIVILLLVMIFVFIHFQNEKHIASVLSIIKNPIFWIKFLICTVLTAFGSFILISEYMIFLGQFIKISFFTAFYVVIFNYVAIFVGIIVPGAPGGLGVREAVLLALLSRYISSETILLTVVAHRIVMILGDAVTVLVSLMFKTSNNFYREINE